MKCECGLEVTKDMLDEDGCCPECGEYVFFDEDETIAEDEKEKGIGCPHCYIEIADIDEYDIPEEGIICPNCKQKIYREDALERDNISFTRTMTSQELAMQMSDSEDDEFVEEEELEDDSI